MWNEIKCVSQNINGLRLQVEDICYESKYVVERHRERPWSRLDRERDWMFDSIVAKYH